MDFPITFLPYAILVVLTGIPALTLLRRVGMHWAWSLLSFIPLGMIAILWIVAYIKWPARPTNEVYNAS